jgi:hypothetical protein
LLVVHRHQGAMASGRLMATGLIAVSAGFLMAALPLALWYVRHLDRIHQLADYYTVGEYNKNLGWRGFLGAGAIAHLDAWWDCYSPDKLFFGGDADLRFSTRSVGYFFLPAAVPLVAGLLAGRRFVSADVWTLLILGLVLSPLPAAFVSNSEAKRWLSFVPFAVLVTTCGVEWLRGAGSTAAQVTAIALLPIARWLTFVPSAVLAGVSGAAWLFAAKRHAAMIGLTALLWLSAIQMRDFFAYYFGLYRVDAAAYFGGNLPGAIRHVLAITGPEDCVLLDTRVYYLDDEWPLYARGNHRLELTTRTTWYGPEAAVTPPSSCGALTALGLAGDQRLEGWQSMLVPELDGKTRFAVYRRDAR